MKINELFIKCKARCWVGGTIECYETGGVDLNIEESWEWEGGDLNCDHDIIDSEYEEPLIKE